MSNITFLVSAVLMVFLLQGNEQTRIEPVALDSALNAPEMVLEHAKNSALSLKSVELSQKEPTDSIILPPQALLTKS